MKWRALKEAAFVWLGSDVQSLDNQTINIIKIQQKHIRFSFAEEQMEKSGCTFKDYSLFPCWCQQTAADCSQQCSCSCTRGKELLFSCVRLGNMKKMKWGMYCKKYKGPTNQECWLTACSSCFWLWVSLRDAVRSGSTQQQTKDRQTDGQAGHVFLTGFLSAEGDPRVRVTSPIKSQSHACSKCLEGLGICRVGWLDCEAQHAEDWTIMCWWVLTVMQLKCPCAENRRRGEYKEKNKKYEDFLNG